MRHTETRGAHENQRAFERRIGGACSGTGATPIYGGRQANIYGSEADVVMAKLKLGPPD